MMACHKDINEISGKKIYEYELHSLCISPFTWDKPWYEIIKLIKILDVK